jgi:FkbM family methyltransferase
MSNDILSQTSRYDQLVIRIREAVDALLPVDCTVAVLGKGDPELLKLSGRRAYHLPADEQGGYLGYHPANSEEAIRQFKSAIAKGADYLLIPSTSLWWLEHYADFCKEMEASSEAVLVDDDLCLIYAISDRYPRIKGRSVAPRARLQLPTANPRPTASATPAAGQMPVAGQRSNAQIAEERDRSDNERIRLLMAAVLSPTSNCIDIGCHQGALLKDILRFAPKGQHIAFEPIPCYYDELKIGFPQVDVRCAALSNKTGESDFRFVVSSPGYSGLKERAYPGEERIETIRVRLQRLDAALPAGYAPDLIKIDVEGGERQVIEGGLETITKFKPVVIFEHGRGASEYYGTRPEHIFDLLCVKAGLRLFDLDGNGPYSLQYFVRVYESGERWNFLARR